MNLSNENTHTPKLPASRLEFTNELKQLLSSLPESERNKSLSYYNEMIDDRIENGMEETAAVACMEPPAVIAGRILAELTPAPAEPALQFPPQKQKMSAGMLALLILGSPLWVTLLSGFFLVVFSVYLAVWSFVVAFFSISLSFAAACVGLIVLSPAAWVRGGFPSFLFAGGIGLVSGAIAIAFWILSMWYVKTAARFTKWSFSKICGMFRRKNK